MCGNSREHALRWLNWMEAETAPQRVERKSDEADDVTQIGLGVEAVELGLAGELKRPGCEKNGL